MPRRDLASILALMLLAPGCTLDLSGLRGAPPFDAGPGVDAGEVDAAGFDAGPGFDAGENDGGGFDAGRTDGGSCTGPDTCEGETAVQCVGGELQRLSCPAMSGYCDMGACVDWACMPNELFCSPDGADVVQCDPRGAGSSTSATCSRGCDGGACRAQTSCPVSVIHTMSAGTYRVDLCGQGADDTFYEPPTTDDCSGYANGPDVIVRVEVAVAGRYQIELVDDDGSRRVDPVLYQRAQCDAEDTMLDCDDDGRGSQDSIMVRDLAAGDHFFVLDCFLYDPPGPNNRRYCGNVELTVTRL